MLKTTALLSALTMFCCQVYGQEDQAQQESADLASSDQELTFCRPREARPCVVAPRVCCEEPKRHGVYLSVSGGVNFANQEAIADAETTLKTGYVFTAAAGYLFKFGVRIELEAAYRRNRIHQRHIDHFDIELDEKAKGYFQSMAYMMDFLYDIPTNYWIVPYFGGGAGCAYNHHHFRVKDFSGVVYIDQNKNGFAWQGIGGLAFVFDHFDITLEYRYYKPNVKKYNDQNVLLGLRYHF
ncbi:MAG TPA: porin family protein [Rhabdochlamydiaceae bacterium]|jgi:opacity protein-like surface antigen|nr:porin family protein [Rhabdochlamydiaceae bacterium]